MTEIVHVYRARCDWQGSTAVGFDDYERAHRGVCPPLGLPMELSSDPSFHGDPDRLNPEQLLVLAASSCQLLSFLAVAARARVDVRSYQDEAEAEMPEQNSSMGISVIHLRPRIVVAGDIPASRLHYLVEVGHRECFIANSLRCEVDVRPVFERWQA